MLSLSQCAEQFAVYGDAAALAALQQPHNSDYHEGARKAYYHARDFLKQLAVLKWSSELPTQPGHYWFRSSDKSPPYIEHVELYGDELWTTPHHSDGRPISMLSPGCEWAGPLPSAPVSP